jgi:hypothetical protein
VAVWLLIALATVGAVLATLTVTLTVAELVRLTGLVASLTTTVKVCTPALRPPTEAVLLAEV